MSVKSASEASLTASAVHTQLTPAEAQALSQYEHTIRKGLDTFIEVGHALFEIRAQRLYHASHSSFEEYCRDKWKFSARQANRLIGAGGVVENLRQDQLVPAQAVAIPQNESQARPLVALTPAKQVEAARIVASKAAQPTAKDFEEAAEEVAEERPRVTVAGGKSNARTATATGKASMESLIELIDQVQTMVKTSKPQAAILAKLKQAADMATRINNGGASC